MSQWNPQRTLAQTDELLCAPGALHELETCLIDGRIQRVYKNLWPSIREFWIWSSQQYSEATYVVFEQQRLSFRDVFQRSVQAAGMYRAIYGIQKGDRVGICSRNYPEYLVAFWACHLVGAVSVLVNAWLPPDVLQHCLSHTQCKLIILDPERADLLEMATKKLTDTGAVAFLVMECHEGKGEWGGMQSWDSAVGHFNGADDEITERGPAILPEDNATIIFTSGTTGLPKGVLSTQRMYLTNVFNVCVGGFRANLRRGEMIPTESSGPQKGMLISVPLFHVTGSTSLAMMASMTGMKIVLMRKWVPEEAARLIRHENITLAGGVPSMALDLMETSIAGYPLETLSFGGAPAPDILPKKAGQVFPSAILSQGYGLTETNSIAVAVAGEDYTLRPTTCGLPTPVNDLVIMTGNTSAPTGVIGEVWVRGPNIMKEYWCDPVATDKAVTKDGWFRTGDLGMLDKEGFLYIWDRIKDIIIRGGENVDSVSVENALYAAEGVLEVGAVGIPHKRLGEIVAAVVSLKPEFRDRVTEASLISIAASRLPKFAIPVMILIQNTPFERTPSGKILKTELRRMAREEWERRLGGKAVADDKISSKL